MKIVILGIMLLILSACTPTPTTTDITDQLQSCVVYASHIDCTLFNGNMLFVDISKVPINYDSSAWEENVAYCPNIMLENMSIRDCKNQTTKFCFEEGQWLNC